MTVRFTDKQRLFIKRYIQCLNATQAAKDAGYKAGNDFVFAQIGSENLRKPHIRAEIDRILNENTISPDEVVGRISDHATGDMGDFVNWSEDFGLRLDLGKAEARGKLHLIKKWKETETTVTDPKGNEKVTLQREITLYDAAAAQDRLMRFYSLYKDRVVHEWKDEAERAGIPSDLAEQFFNQDVQNLAEKMANEGGNS